MWATTLLHNVDTLEVYEDAIRQTEANLQQPTDRNEPTSRALGECHPLSHASDQPATTSATTHARPSPRARQPRPTKTNDPSKQQRQQHHTQTVIHAAERRRQLETARAETVLPTIPEDPTHMGPDKTQ